MATIESLLDFSKAWDAAMTRNDPAEIGKFMSDDWVIIGTEGGITTKATFMQSIESGDLLHSRMDSGDIRIRIYGSTGVLTSRGTSAGTYKGNSFSFFEWSTSLFVLNENKWSCVLTMLTPA